MKNLLWKIHSFIVLDIAFLSASLLVARCKSGEHKQPESYPITNVSAQQNQERQPKYSQFDTTGYNVFQVLRPSMQPESSVIIMTILQDNRLKGLQAKMNYYRGLKAAHLELTTDMEMLNPDVKFKPAMVVVKDNKGNIISCRLLDVPCARIDSAWLDESRTALAYLLTLDYSTGMGSYNGPLTSFVQFADTGIVAFTGDNGFANTLKSAWAIKYTGNKIEIWSKICRPNENEDFTTTAKKIQLQSGTLVAKATTKPGIWENEGDTTAASLKEFLDGF